MQHFRLRIGFLVIVAAFLALLPRLAFSIQKSDKQENQVGIKYHCPPCGCENDNIALNSAGSCSICGMALVAKNSGFKGEIEEIVTPIFYSGMLGMVYTKLIYPIFAIGILFSIVMLAFKFRDKSVNIYLIGIVLIISLFSFKNQLYGVNYGITSTHRSLFTPISFILALGPLIFFYVKSLTQNYKFKKIDLLHFVPAGLMFLYYSILVGVPDNIQYKFMFSPFEILFGHAEQILAVISGIIYMALSYRVFQKWRVSYSVSMSQTNSWIIRFLISMISLFAVWSLIIFINYWLYDFGVATVTYNPLWVWMGLIVGWVGVEILLNPKFFLVNKSSAFTNGSKIINDLELTHYKLKLQELMDIQKVYTNPELSLDMLASVMNINPRYLSTFLNNVIGKSFYDYINKYRIEEVKILLKDPTNKNLTIEAIANLAGFKSKSSFNSAFKKYTQMTPREYMKHEMVA